MKTAPVLMALFVILISAPAFAGYDNVYGDITAYTAIPQGLMLFIGNGQVPGNCGISGGGWMIILQEDKTMLSVALMKISQDRMGVGLYSDGTKVDGLCRVNQIYSTD